MQQMTHILKTIQPYFSHVLEGLKTFEVRKYDRPFRIGDILDLREFHPDHGYSGANIKMRVTYILPGGQFGLELGYVVMGIEKE